MYLFLTHVSVINNFINVTALFRIKLIIYKVDASNKLFVYLLYYFISHIFLKYVNLFRSLRVGSFMYTYINQRC